MVGLASEEKGKKRKVNFVLESFPFCCRYRYSQADGYPTPIGFREEKGKKRKVKFFCHLMTKKCS